MLAPLKADHVDTRAADLSWVVGVEPLDPLAELVIELPPGPLATTGVSRLALRILGASHQALFTAQDTHGAAHFSETVACLPGNPAGLPGDVKERFGPWAYSFTASVRRYPSADFRRRVQRLQGDMGSCRNAIAGTFPDSPYAVTAAAAVPGDARVTWQTWHTYPREGEIVVTRSEVIVP